MGLGLSLDHVLVSILQPYHSTEMKLFAAQFVRSRRKGLPVVLIGLCFGVAVMAGVAGRLCDALRSSVRGPMDQLSPANGATARATQQVC